MYAQVDETNQVVQVITALPLVWKNVSNFPRLDEAGQKALGWYSVNVTQPAYDPETEKLVGPVDTFNDTLEVVERVYTVQALTPAEIEARDSDRDLEAVKQAGIDMVLILTELVPWLLANTAMTPDDFTPAVKQAYLDLKAVADRIRARL